MIRSFERSFSVRKPSASRQPTSPVCSQPLASVAARRLRIAPVALHHRRTAHQDLADLAGRQRGIVVGADANVDAGLRGAHRAEARIVATRRGIGDDLARHRGDGHRRLALAVDLRELRSQRRQRGLAVLDVHRRAADDDALQAIETRVPHRGMRDEALDHGRRGEEARAIPALQQRDDLGRIEAAGIRHHVHGSRQDMRQHIETGAMRQRRRVQDRVAGPDRFDVGEKAQAHRQQVAVREHDALGAPGGAAGVEQPRRIVRRHGGGREVRGRREQSLVVAAAEFDDTLQRGQFRRAWRQRRMPRRIDEHPARAAVLEHVGEFVGVQLAVHRDHARPRVPAGEHALDVRGAVGGDDGHAIPRNDATGAQAGRQLRHSRLQPFVGVAHLISDRDRRQCGEAARAPLQHGGQVVDRRAAVLLGLGPVRRLVHPEIR